MTSTFDISPEKRASFQHYLYRQFFVTPPPVSTRDVNLEGKTVLITGGNGGLGIEAASQVLDLGGKVILAVRDEKKGQVAKEDLTKGRSHLLPGDIQVWPLDLSSYDSIIALKDRVKQLEHLDIAILNAGVFKVVESFSTTGYEESIQINFLSNMLLTILLLPIIQEKKSSDAPGRICVVSSDAAAWAHFNERNNSPILSAFKQKMSKWNMGDRYGTSKLLGQLFLTELTKRVASSAVIVDCANPGFCGGLGLGRETAGIFRLLYNISSAIHARSCAVGARTLVHAVTTVDKTAHGQYVEDAKIQPMAVIVYKPEGLRLAKQLYEETLDELSFAGVSDIIDGISKIR